MKNLILSKNFLIAIAVILVVVPIVLFAKNFFSKKLEGDENKNVISGLLLINTDKSKSIPGEKVIIQITSLDGDSKTLCDSNLKLEIIKDNEVISEPDISNTSSCTQSGNISLNPDYTSYFIPYDEGEYQIKLTNLDNQDLSQIPVIVSKDLSDLSITRWGANKVKANGLDRYPMKFTLTANNDFAGKLVEQIPPHLKVVWQGPAKVEKTDDGQIVTWEINLDKGETKEYTYEYTVATENSDNFTLGNVKLVSKEKVYFEETRPWIIAINRE